MPAELDVDKEAVRVLVVAVGVREAARQCNLNENTVLAWANRGGWLQSVADAKERARAGQLQRSTETILTVQSTAIKPADALAATLAEGIKETKLGLTAYTARMAKQAATSGNLEEAPLYKAVADIHGKMHPEVTTDNSVHLQFFSISQERAEEGPVIDLPE